MKADQMEKVAFLITTFNRSEACRALVENISEHGDVYILDDASLENYDWASQYNYQVQTDPGRKKEYYRTVTNLWQMVKKSGKEYKYFIMLPDDFIPEPNFLKKSIDTWKSIQDTRKICLNLYTDVGRLNGPNWTGVHPQIHPEARRIQWVDMCFLAEKEFFLIFDWTCPRPPEAWNSHQNLGSGVGASISRYLHNLNYGIWQTHASMFMPGPEAFNSKMNGFRNGTEANKVLHQTIGSSITVQIASLPERANMLEKTIASLRPQVDRIFVALNGYSYTPDFLNEGEYIHLDNSTGDAAKFYDVENINGYLFTCDDDLIYPPTYVRDMIYNIHRYQAIVSLHGKKYPRPVVHFKGHAAQVHCLADADNDLVVDVPGTGVMALHTSMIKIKYADFQSKNMADIWMGKIAQEQGRVIVALAHRKDYLTYQGPEWTIYEAELKKNFEEQNRLLAQIFN